FLQDANKLGPPKSQEGYSPGRRESWARRDSRYLPMNDPLRHSSPGQQDPAEKGLRAVSSPAPDSTSLAVVQAVGFRGGPALQRIRIHRVPDDEAGQLAWADDGAGGRFRSRRMSANLSAKAEYVRPACPPGRAVFLLRDIQELIGVQQHLAPTD